MTATPVDPATFGLALPEGWELSWERVENWTAGRTELQASVYDGNTLLYSSQRDVPPDGFEDGAIQEVCIVAALAAAAQEGIQL